MTHDTLKQARALLDNADRRLAEQSAVIGLDGFVDRIQRPVARVDTAAGTNIHFPGIADFAERVRAAAGKSAAIALDTQQVKLGGNGPIMAHALAALGLPLTYVGAVGHGNGIHPVFHPLAESCDVVPVCPVAKTDALEFDDGKLMLQQMDCLAQLTWDAIVEALGADRLQQAFDAATLLGLNHWASLPHMNDIWQALQTEVCPRLTPAPRRVAFFDLGDLVKRSADEIATALTLIAGFNPWYDTALGVNMVESETICQALGLATDDDLPEDERVCTRARRLQQATGIGLVAVHPLACAAAADADGAAVVPGPYTPKPKISTGAGDHFNSGLCLGLLLGGGPAGAVQLGVAASGYYVRHAASASTQQLAGFLEEMQN